MWQLALVDVASFRIAAFLTEFQSFSISPAINGYATLDVEVNTSEEVARKLVAGRKLGVARFALKAWQDGTLRFFGKVWEPLEVSSTTISIKARDPWAEFDWRRLQGDTSYTATNHAGGPWDAGDIALDRVAVQNARRNTYLRATTANRQLSVNRTIAYGPGKSESELVNELANAAQGFFFRIDPVDGVYGVMADLKVLYPDAGQVRSEVRLEYGPDTAESIADFKLTGSLPRNRQVSSGTAAAGGRITQIAEDTVSQLANGLFEDEVAYPDVHDTALLLAAAQSEIHADAPVVVEITPNAETPLVYTSFREGDFVRLRIKYAGVDIDDWVRVLDAELVITEDGSEELTSLTVEFVTGGQVGTPINRRFRSALDDMRTLLEALARKVEDASAPDTAPPGDGAGGTPDVDPVPDPVDTTGSDPTPVDPDTFDPPTTTDPPPDEPPVAPESPVAGPEIFGVGVFPTSSSSIQMECTGTTGTPGGNVFFEVHRASASGPLVKLTTPRNYDGVFDAIESVDGLSRDTTYFVTAWVNSPSGRGQSAFVSATTFHND